MGTWCSSTATPRGHGSDEHEPYMSMSDEGPDWGANIQNAPHFDQDRGSLQNETPDVSMMESSDSLEDPVGASETKSPPQVSRNNDLPQSPGSNGSNRPMRACRRGHRFNPY